MNKKNINKSIGQRVRELLSRMTIEEKIGQLNQVGLSLAGAFDVSQEELVNMLFDGRVSRNEFEKLLSSSSRDFREEELRAGRIGSYNGIGDAETICRLQKIAVEETRLGIPLIFGYDVIHGFRTITPIPLGESCAWDPDLWERTARMSAVEASAAGVNMTFAPMIDVAKDARWGRISEGAGEDTLLASVYGVSKVRGFQTDDPATRTAVASCIKHFAAYGAVESGRDYNRVDMSLQKLCEEYLPPFKACVKAGALGVMPAFNDLNGVPCTVNNWLLDNVLRKEWGFNGVIVSDAHAIKDCVAHGIAEDGSDAAYQAISSGTDIDMISGLYSQYLRELIEQGRLDIEALDKAVSNVLRVKFELGLFEDPYRTDSENEKKNMLTSDNRALARESAVKSMVLLRNEGVLPLQTGIRIGIAGTLASDKSEMTGTWAIRAVGEDCISIADAFEARGINIICITDTKDIHFNEVDVYIVAAGERKSQSGEAASRSDIGLQPEESQIIDILLSTGKPVIVVLFNGRPLAIPGIANKAHAILEAWHPGVEAGNAVLDILFGDVNPSGKLTTTFPHTAGQCPVYYDHINTSRPAGVSKFTSKYLDIPTEPVYPFGFGLSYTTYLYSNMHTEVCEDGILCSVIVCNTGRMDGDEIVQCYIHDIAAARVRPVKKLVDFIRISLARGEEKEVSFLVRREKLGYYDRDMKFRVDDGIVDIYIGSSSQELLQSSVRLIAGER